MLETHPYGIFVPPRPHYLILGSFPGKPVPGNDWYYSSPRNQFWPILESVYGLPLRNKLAKKRLLSRLGIALGDIMLQCERTHGSNLDINLKNIVFNTQNLSAFFKKNHPRKIYFTSRFVERHFKTLFPGCDIPQTSLPSPSPRFARLSLTQKIKIYLNLLPVDKISSDRLP
jgi:hypoxanthine-DNA glycosylase